VFVRDVRDVRVFLRWTSLLLLAHFGEDVDEEPALLDRLLAALRSGEADRLKLPPPCMRQIEASLILIRPYERLYQAVQFLFDAVRAATTDEPEVRLDALAPTPACVSACEGARKAATDLLDAVDKAEAVHTQTTNEVRSTFADAGIVSVAEALCRPSKGDEVLGLVLDRHRDVQQGKFDRGERKAA
jgi:hypothetical protein